MAFAEDLLQQPMDGSGTDSENSCDDSELKLLIDKVHERPKLWYTVQYMKMCVGGWVHTSVCACCCVYVYNHVFHI